MVWAALKVFWTFLKGIPWQVWAALGIALAVLYFGHTRYKAGYAEAEGHYIARFHELERQAALARLEVQQALKERDAIAEELKLEHEKQLAEAETKRLKDLEAQKRRLTANVTTENTRSCPDLPRSYILFRHAAADHANATDRGPETVGATAGVEPEPSGVSLPSIAETDLAQADAFREAVTWGTAWRDYAERTKTTCEAQFEILTR